MNGTVLLKYRIDRRAMSAVAALSPCRHCSLRRPSPGQTTPRNWDSWNIYALRVLGLQCSACSARPACPCLCGPPRARPAPPCTPLPGRPSLDERWGAAISQITNSKVARSPKLPKGPPKVPEGPRRAPMAPEDPRGPLVRSRHRHDRPSRATARRMDVAEPTALLVNESGRGGRIHLLQGLVSQVDALGLFHATKTRPVTGPSFEVVTWFSHVQFQSPA